MVSMSGHHLGFGAAAKRVRRSNVARGVALGSAVLLLTACNPLFDNWSGQPRWTKDTAFEISGLPSVNQDSESADIFFKNQWFLFSRDPTPSPTIPGGLSIGVSTSANGANHWSSRGIAIANGGPVGCVRVNDPKVLVQPGLLTMVYEADPYESDDAGCPFSAHQEVIALSTSTDGVNWTPPRLIIQAEQAWEGATMIPNGRQMGNVGSPTITQVGDTYYVGYDAFSGQNMLPLLQRGYQSWTVSSPTLIQNGNKNHRNTKPSMFTAQDGSPETNTVYSVGYGGADIMQCQGGNACGGDTGYYMVFEGFAVTPFCSAPDGGPPYPKVVIAIARADSPTGPWAIQNDVLLGQKQKCGRDEPSWQYTPRNHTYHVILSGNNALGLQRISLSNTA